MKLKLFLLSLATAGLLTSCVNTPKGDEASVEGEQTVAEQTGATYSVTPESVIYWVGSKPVGTHNGSINLSSGQFSMSEGVVTGGDFVIDINSLKVLDEGGEAYAADLQGHLLSDDFLASSTYPTAKFEITKVEPYTATPGAESVIADANYSVSGNLTIRDTTNNITFPAAIMTTENGVSVKASFNIDRTWWKIVYGNDQSLGDKFIRPEVNITLDVTAK